MVDLANRASIQVSKFSHERVHELIKSGAFSSESEVIEYLLTEFDRRPSRNRGVHRHKAVTSKLSSWFSSDELRRVQSIREKLDIRTISPGRELALLLALIDYCKMLDNSFLPWSKITKISKNLREPTITTTLIRGYIQIIKKSSFGKQNPLPKTTSECLRTAIRNFCDEITYEGKFPVSKERILKTGLTIESVLDGNRYYPRDLEQVAWGCISVSFRFHEIPTKRWFPPTWNKVWRTKVQTSSYRILAFLKKSLSKECPSLDDLRDYGSKRETLLSKEY